MNKTHLSSEGHLSRVAHLSPRSGIYPGAPRPFIARSAFILLLWCAPALLAAQNGNGVTIANLAVSAGSPTTVTFDVSWNKTPMPTVWSDTVWVFVDYNQNGKMVRLPLLSGATLIATSPGGKVIEEPNNNKGIWVAGNARGTGSFSATVRLLTSIADVAGACAYASNYPPVGEYKNNATEISFIGTPPYEISLIKPGGGNVTVLSDDRFLLPCNYTPTSFTDATGAPGVMENYCTMPGSTVNFTAFNPCPNVATGTTWTLQDTREAAYGNTQTYKVKKMVDGHIWMVQDLKFGNLCGTDFAGSNGADQTGKVSSIGTYYGDCSAATNTSTPPNRGYHYDWAATINKSGAFYGSTLTVGCSGTATAANACQGICPAGWHIPTGDSSGEYQALHTAGGCATNNVNCWDASSAWEGVFGGWNSGSPSDQGRYAFYWTSTNIDKNDAYHLCFTSSVLPGTRSYGKYAGFTVRCVRNY